ncbi:uncharacterized protein EI90DRAFT_2933604 [Cantharellus anzutake]|uniref:uncharacterized protein n=1 Tax=Cantharellus anzutake TaxID=1750568 RepID=UPI001905856E|nr:uncharacterized protein EI90DRAFT_2933604 [Cantharellus anzutake]KAF8324906.1 hypothetical protein EI90DRAFT_2933604 [Cantharellus anzutake]
MDAIPPPVPAKAFPPTTRPRKRRSISSTRSVPRNHQRRPSTAGSVANSFVDPSTQQQQQPFDARYHRFRSPLHRLGHAPLLRVFVPSPEGNWLSDNNVIRCEEELRKAGIVHLLKTGDVVWDVAVGEEGNVGRLIWDGAYLIDLDYSYSLTGELPPYVDSLCFPPSYWHKVLRIAGNPICYLDIRPYSQEIAMNIALIQSRVQTETPQGHLHNVVRWIHRSSFQIRSETPLLPIQPNSTYHGRTPTIDAAWEGTVFIEAEGTNEGLEDLQARCGNTAQLVAPKPGVVVKKLPSAKGKTIFRMVRGSSRPGELWLRCVSEKERVL